MAKKLKKWQAAIIWLLVAAIMLTMYFIAERIQNRPLQIILTVLIIVWLGCLHFSVIIGRLKNCKSRTSKIVLLILSNLIIVIMAGTLVLQFDTLHKESLIYNDLHQKIELRRDETSQEVKDELTAQIESLRDERDALNDKLFVYRMIWSTSLIANCAVLGVFDFMNNKSESNEST